MERTQEVHHDTNQVDLLFHEKICSKGTASSAVAPDEAIVGVEYLSQKATASGRRAVGKDRAVIDWHGKLKRVWMC